MHKNNDQVVWVFLFKLSFFRSIFFSGTFFCIIAKQRYGKNKI